MQSLESTQALLEQCRTAPTQENVTQCIEACMTAEDPDSLLTTLGTTRCELQRLLWQTSSAPYRVAHPLLVPKVISGSSFDRGSYNFG